MLNLMATRRLARAFLARRRPLRINGPAEEFFVNGFVRRQFEGSASLIEVLKILQDLSGGEVRAPFSFEEKSPRYFLLRPSPSNYSDAFEDLLFEGRIPQLLEELTGSPLYLAAVTVLRHLPGIAVNTEWHRDTNFQPGELVGPIPPSVKVYFYPSLGGPPTPRINFVRGSNRVDFHRAFVDELMGAVSRPTTVHSSDEHFVVFDTTTLHQAIPDRDPSGSIRLLYTFYRKKEQIQTRHSLETAHQLRYQQRAGLG